MDSSSVSIGRPAFPLAPARAMSWHARVAPAGDAGARGAAVRVQHAGAAAELYLRDGRVVLAVTQSDAAFQPGAPAEDLDGIAQRLRVLYGNNARFGLERAAGRRTRAVLEIPHEIADSSHR
jgi:hypothetical protein